LWVISSWKKYRGRKVDKNNLDLRRASEMVDREILLSKLKRYSTKGIVFQ